MILALEGSGRLIWFVVEILSVSRLTWGGNVQRLDIL